MTGVNKTTQTCWCESVCIIASGGLPWCNIRSVTQAVYACPLQPVATIIQTAVLWSWHRKCTTSIWRPMGKQILMIAGLVQISLVFQRFARCASLSWSQSNIQNVDLPEHFAVAYIFWLITLMPCLAQCCGWIFVRCILLAAAVHWLCDYILWLHSGDKI